MDYKILDKIGGERETWIVVSFFLIFVVCVSWWFDTGIGYYLRLRHGTQIKIGDVEIIIPNGYYIVDKKQGVYSICDNNSQKIQFLVEGWNGTPKISKIKERFVNIGGEVHSYNMNGYLVYEFFIRSDTWRKEYGAVMYLFPQLHIQFMYIGSLTTMYPTMNKFVRSFKKIQETSPDIHPRMENRGQSPVKNSITYR